MSKATAARKKATTALAEVVELDAMASTITALRRVKARLDKLDTERAGLERDIKAALGRASKGTVRGKPVVQLVRATRKTLAVKLIRERHPEIAKECTVTTEVRTLRLVDPS